MNMIRCLELDTLSQELSAAYSHIHSYERQATVIHGKITAHLGRCPICIRNKQGEIKIPSIVVVPS